jgi:branched-chain amino acid transport system ATP-binding protein
MIGQATGAAIILSNGASRRMLETRGVKKAFGGLVALKGVDIAVPPAKITSLIGPNGAGKTTLFNIISGALKPDSGKVIFAGTDITGKPPYRVSQLGIARTFQLRNIFHDLSVFENVNAGFLKDQGSRPSENRERAMDIIAYLGLKEKSNRPVSSLSPLEMKLVELGRALATRPRLLLLDELLGGLIGPETQKICEFIEDLRFKGYTILQIGHEMKPIMRTSDWIYVLSEGEKIAEGPPETIRQNGEVLAIYLELEE